MEWQPSGGKAEGPGRVDLGQEGLRKRTEDAHYTLFASLDLLPGEAPVIGTNTWRLLGP